MDTQTADLLSPIALGSLELPNRVVMAPLTRNRAGHGNTPQALNETYYQQRATAGLIITEATQISPEGQGYPATPGIHSVEQVAGWKLVTEKVHGAGGRIFNQLWHVGRISHPSMLPDGMLPVAPSAIRPAGEAFTYEGLQPFVTPRALETDEIPIIVAEYAAAAKNAKAAGFDGIEVHAANGYLIDQFLRDGSNHRSDRYGGSVEHRTRLLMEVLDAVCDVWPQNRVGVRISPLNPFNDMNDSDPERLFRHVCHRLNDFDLAYLHVVEGAIMPPEDFKPAFDVRTLRGVYDGHYMANGGYDLARGNAALQNGADLVSFGSLYIANPDLVARFRTGATLNEPDEATFYGGGAEGYTDYPFMEVAEAP